MTPQLENAALWNVFPRVSVFCLYDNRLADSKFLSDSNTCSRVGPDLSDNGIGKLGFVMSGTSRHALLASAMTKSVRLVFDGRSPAQITGSVIDSMPVAMSNFVHWARAVTMKSLTHKAMDVKGLTSARVAQVNDCITSLGKRCLSYSFGPSAMPSNSSYTPQRRSFIFRRLLNWFPNLFHWRNGTQYATLLQGNKL